jgi:hypothetical protein
MCCKFLLPSLFVSNFPCKHQCLLINRSEPRLNSISAPKAQNRKTDLIHMHFCRTCCITSAWLLFCLRLKRTCRLVQMRQLLLAFNIITKEVCRTLYVPFIKRMVCVACGEVSVAQCLVLPSGQRRS